MTVLHVAETLKGGLETYLRIVLTFQSNSANIGEVKAILPERVDWLNVDRTFVVPTNRSFLSLVKYARQVKEIIESERPSVLHLHSSIAGGIIRSMALIGLLDRSIKIIYCAHGWAFDQEVPVYKKLAYRWIERLLSWRSDAIICISGHETRIAKKLGIRRCRCIPNGVNRPEPAPGQSINRGTATEPRNILFVGRLDRQKGIDVLLDAYARVRPKFKLIIVGDSVRKDLQLTRPTYVEFKGWLGKEELDAVYRTCDAIIVPSRWEGFGLVAIEAMARSKAVFASAVGGLVEIVEDGKSGQLFSLDQMDQALRDIDSIPNETLQQMGRIGRHIFDEKFTSQRMNTAIINLYEEFMF